MIKGPIKLTKENAKILSQLLSPAKKEREKSLTIESYMENRNKKLEELKELEDYLESLKKEIENLENLSVIKHYLELCTKYPEEVKKYERRKKDIEKEIYASSVEICPHPLYAVHHGKAVCVLCGKEHQNISSEQSERGYEEFLKLIKEKKLIADIDWGYNFREGSYYYLKEVATLDEIRQVYQNIYANKLTKDDLVEQLVWDYFYNNYKEKNKVKVKKKRI